MYSFDVTKFVGTPRLDDRGGGLVVLPDFELYRLANNLFLECDRWNSDLAQSEVESNKLSFHRRMSLRSLFLANAGERKERVRTPEQQEHTRSALSVSLVSCKVGIGE